MFEKFFSNIPGVSNRFKHAILSIRRTYKKFMNNNTSDDMILNFFKNDITIFKKFVFENKVVT